VGRFSVGEGRTGAAFTLIAAVVAVAVAFFVIAAAIASYKTSGVRRQWEHTLGTRDEILDRYPTTEADSRALDLERLGAELGIDLAPRHHEERAHPSRERTAEFSSVKAELGNYFRIVIERPHRGGVAPPANVAAFLESHAEDLEAVRSHLIDRGVPIWETDLTRGHAAPVPNLLGHIDLQKLLIADALAAVATGDRETALADLEAGWILMQALGGSPFLIAELIAMSGARLIVGTLRQVEDPPFLWHDRLTGHDFRQEVIQSLKYEGWHWTRIGGPWTVGGVEWWGGKLLGSVAEPYVRFCLAHTSDDYRERVTNLEAIGAICDHDLSARRADLDLSIPDWNLVGGMVPNFSGIHRRIAQLELDMELTVKLIELEQGRRANGGAWPDTPQGIADSRACPGDRWIYQVSPDGEMTLAFSREISWPGLKGPDLPERFGVKSWHGPGPPRSRPMPRLDPF
jgi:hypothetical protein